MFKNTLTKADDMRGSFGGQRFNHRHTLWIALYDDHMEKMKTDKYGCMMVGFVAHDLSHVVCAYMVQEHILRGASY